MKNLSGFQIVLIAAFAAFAVAGVLIFAFAVSNGTQSAIGPVTIWGTFSQSDVTRALQELSENDPDLLQVTYVQKDASTYLRELTDALAAGTGPDLFLLRSDYAYLFEPRVTPLSYESLSRANFEERFIDAARPFLGAGGVTAIPLLADPLVLYWNRDLLAAAGFANPPRYWGEILDIAPAVTKRAENGSIETAAIHFGEYRNVAHAKLLLSMLIMQAGGAITERTSEGALTQALTRNTGPGRQAAIDALRFYTQFADPSKDLYSWNRALPEARTAFTSGDLALYYGLASEAAAIRAANPNLNIAMADMAQARDTETVRALDGGYLYALAVPRTARDPESAFVVAFKLASADASALLADRLGVASARRDVLGDARGADAIVERHAILMRTWTDPDPQATDEIFRAMIEDTTSGAALLTEAVQRAEQRLNTLLQP